MNRNHILLEAINTFGLDSQRMMMIEEMSELTKAISKFYRAKDIEEEAAAVESIKEEIADVQIVLDQMKIIFGDTVANENYKLRRLEKRISEYKGLEV